MIRRPPGTQRFTTRVSKRFWRAPSGLHARVEVEASAILRSSPSSAH